MYNQKGRIAPQATARKMDWLSYHLYYHQNLNRATVGFVYPVVTTLLQRSCIDSFFFVRYGLGGPHIRLRLRVLRNCERLVDEAVHRASEEFLRREPSTSTLPEYAILHTNQMILASDPHETDNSVYSDNTLLSFPFHPEVQRYGGGELLPASLDFFAVSSVAAIGFLLQYGEESRQRQLVPALCLLLRQALSFANDEEELLALAAYGVTTWGKSLPAVIAKGDRVFAGQRETFLGLLRKELETLSSESGDYFCKAAHRLSRAVATPDPSTRRRIGISQLHMTATRIGLMNPEEAYISQLMVSTLREMLAAKPTLASLWKEAWDQHRGIEIFTPDTLSQVLARLGEASPS
jgi:hypothetical protein